MVIKFLKCESGVSSIEYGIIASVIVVALVTILIAIRTKVINKMNTVNGVMTHSSY